MSFFEAPYFTFSMKLIVFITIAFSVCTVPMLAQEYQLRYDMPENDSYRFKQVEETTALAQSNDGRTVEIDRKTTRYLHLTVEGVSDGAITYTVLQDTAIVEENNEDPRVQRQNLLSQNILTGKRIRVRQSRTGDILETRALDPLNAREALGPAVNDAMFVQRAAILPKLPERTLRVNIQWTEQRGDTLQPTKTLPGYGTGNGVRYIGSSTEYTVDGTETLQDRDCLVLTWKSNGSMEEALMFETLEEFNEEFTKGSGTMKIALESGLPLWVEVYSDQETTRAIFGKQTSIIPASISTHTTLEFFSQ